MSPSDSELEEKGGLGAQERAERSAEAMLKNDHATNHLGMSVERVEPGYAKIQMRVVKDMLNGHATCHGGFLFTLSDSAFAFACNSYNQVAVAASASIEFIAPAYIDDVLTAQAKVQMQGGRTGLYDVEITNQDNERIALFRGRSHRLKQTLFDETSVSTDKPAQS